MSQFAEAVLRSATGDDTRCPAEISVSTPLRVAPLAFPPCYTPSCTPLCANLKRAMTE